MNELVNSAHKTYEDIVFLRKSINENFWTLVEKLKAARENRIWALLGHESWMAFLAQPEIDLNERTVTDYIYIYESISKHIKTTDMSDKMIPFDIDIGKLKLIAPTITKENAEELFEKAKTLSRSDLRRELRPETVTPTLPEGIYNVIYADPAWQYDFSETISREIENQYPTMSVEEISSLVVPSAKDSVLFLWATAPKLKEACFVIEEWGFEYKTHSIWDKQQIGMGYWFRGQHELLLVATKGSFSPPEPEDRVSSVYSEKRTEHSKKPEYYYSLIERMFPKGKYLELFARHTRKGWTSWGNEV